jgi:hypothetical protein
MWGLTENIDTNVGFLKIASARLSLQALLTPAEF